MNVKDKKRELLSDDDEEEPWWESFKSQSTQKSTQNTQLQEFKSSQVKAEASSSQDDNKSDDEEEQKDDKKISFYLKLGKYKKFKYMWFLFLESKMNHVNTNWINNYFYMYGIENTEENFEKLREVIKERNFIIYHIILYMIDNCWVIEEDSTGITIEIDLFEHRKLLEDLTNSFFTKKISTRKVKKKNWTHLFCGKSILDNKNLQRF